MKFVGPKVEAPDLLVTAVGDQELYQRSGTSVVGFDANVLPINAQTGTSYTLVLADANKLITFDASGTIIVTVPSNSTPFPIGTAIALAQLGSGQINVVGGTGVSINGVSGGTPVSMVNKRYASTAVLIKLDSNEWVLTGAVV